MGCSIAKGWVYDSDLRVRACLEKLVRFFTDSIASLFILVFLGHGFGDGKRACPGAWHLADGAVD